jgi:serine/threonine protein kinase
MEGVGNSGAPGPSDEDAPDDDPLLRAIARAPSVAPVSRQDGMQAHSLIGEILDGKYRVDAVLGSGGMGAVYRATHVGTRREVALKVLLPELTARESLVERFRREAQAAGQLRHPNIVDVTDFGFATRGDDRLAYLIMELVRGKTLRALLEQGGRLDLEVAVDILDQVCAAMSEAHRLGVLHRDLKPENILLEPAGRGHRVKVVDFGIAKLTPGAPAAPASSGPPPGEPGTVDATAATMPAVEDPGSAATTPAVSPLAATASGESSEALTRRGSVLGTPLYMSPEQWRGAEVDARTDVYSLGVVAYELLAGEPPFLGKTKSIALEHAEDPPPPLAARAPKVPRRITSVIEAALAKKPDDRPPSVAAFAASLHVGRETTVSLLRRSVALAFNHFGALSLHCAVLTVPRFTLWVMILTTYLLARLGTVSPQTPLVIALGGGPAINTWIMFVSAAVAGLLVPPVADLLASRTTGRRPTLAAVVRTALGSLPSTLVSAFVLIGSSVVTLVAVFFAAYLSAGLQDDAGRPMLAPPAVGILTGLAAVPFAIVDLFVLTFSSLVGPVVAVERARGLAPLWRSFTLVRPVWRPALGVLLFYALLTQGLDWILLRVLEGGATAAPPGQMPYDFLTPSGFLAAMAENSKLLEWTLLGLPIAILLTPFSFVPFALLYIRAREAEGKPLVAEP